MAASWFNSIYDRLAGRRRKTPAPARHRAPLAVAGRAPVPEARPRAAINPDRERAFQQATRHSRLVRRLRYVLPAGAMILIIALPLTALNTAIPGLAGLSLDGIGVSGATIVMENPRLNGYEKGRGGYRFEAARAEQNINETDKIRLTELSGRITQDDGRWASIRARQGVIDTEAEIMQLDRDIIVRADGGYRALLQSAEVELKEGNVRTDDPVQVDILNGSVNAQSLELIERGRYIRFDGDVRMTIYLGGLEDAGQAGNAASAEGAATNAGTQ